jgi:F-type H+-transporting ATPase subunit delta
MAETATIARPYAEALFAMADKSNSLGQWSETLAHLAAVAQAPEMSQLLGNPKVTSVQFVGLFSNSDGSLPAEAKAFLQLLAENRRLEALPAVHEQFELLKAEREGAVDAVIETAFPFQAGELEALIVDLERRFKRKIRPQVSLNKDLIGGAKVSVGDQVIDGTVRGKLDAMNAGLMGS